MTALTLGLLIALHGFAGQIILSGGSGSGSGGGGGGSSMTFSTNSTRADQLRAYGVSTFPMSQPFGVSSADTLNAGATLIEPFRVIDGGLTASPVPPRTDAIPGENRASCVGC